MTRRTLGTGGIARVVAAAALVASCGSAPPPTPRAPEHDLDAPVHVDAGTATIDAAQPPVAAVSTVDAEAVRVLEALAAEIRAAIASVKLDPGATDFDPRCHELDRKLAALRARANLAGDAAALRARANLAGDAAARVREDSVRAAKLANELPFKELAAVLDTCRARYQMELPGTEGLIDDVDELVPQP